MLEMERLDGVMRAKQYAPDEWKMLTKTVEDPDGRGTTYAGVVNLGLLPWLRPYCVDIPEKEENMTKTKTLCILCVINSAVVPDREQSSIVKKICSVCHACRIRGDLQRILAHQAPEDLPFGTA